MGAVVVVAFVVRLQALLIKDHGGQLRCCVVFVVFVPLMSLESLPMFTLDIRQTNNSR